MYAVMYDKQTKMIEATEPLARRYKCVMKCILMFGMYLQVTIVTFKDTAKLAESDHYYRFFNFNQHFKKHTAADFLDELSYYYHMSQQQQKAVQMPLDVIPLQILLSPPPSPRPQKQRRSRKKSVSLLRRSERLSNRQRSSRRLN